MTDSKPLVSFVMPVYNATRYLREALDSMLAQTVDDWELIAVDDCSTDDSAAILDEYAAHDPRVRAFRNEVNSGVGGTLDHAIAEARGQFIARMDADDVCVPERLAVQIKYLQNHPEIIAVGGQILEMREDGTDITLKHFPSDPDEVYGMMFLSVPIQHPALMVNRAMLPDDFTWYEGWRVGEDSNLFFKLTRFGKLSNVPETVLRYRVCQDGNLMRNIRATFRNTYRARRLALQQYGYHASLKARVINQMQFVVVHVVPERALLKLYNLVRATMLKLGGEKR